VLGCVSDDPDLTAPYPTIKAAIAALDASAPRSSAPPGWGGETRTRTGDTTIFSRGSRCLSRAS